jgi:hypothetical protein
MVWEYTTVQLVARGFEEADQNDGYQQLLAEYGLNGWELVSAVSFPSGQIAGQIVVLFFKRPLPTG